MTFIEYNSKNWKFSELNYNLVSFVVSAAASFQSNFLIKLANEMSKSVGNIQLSNATKTQHKVSGILKSKKPGPWCECPAMSFAFFSIFDFFLRLKFIMFYYVYICLVIYGTVSSSSRVRLTVPLLVGLTVLHRSVKGIHRSVKRTHKYVKRTENRPMKFSLLSHENDLTDIGLLVERLKLYD